MNIATPERIPRREWIGMMGAAADDGLLALMDEAEEMILTAARPRGIYRLMDMGDVPVEGYSLAKHLEDCHSAVIMAVTLGGGIDGLIRRLQIRDMAMAVIADTGASALVEAVCDTFEEEIGRAVDGYVTRRFSPGYGDSPLSLQRRMVDLVDGGRKIGLSLTPDCLMVPRKSVTAVIGVSDVPVTGRLATCGECVLREKCTLRKEGKFCGD